MKTKSIKKNERWHISWIMLTLIILCFGSCKSDKNEDEVFDPSKTMVVSDFIPKQGSINTRLILQGENFGTDVSKIKVTVGGIEAKVIGADGNNIYCIVPPKAYEGTIEVAIVDDNGEKILSAKPDTKFTYEKKMLVSTLLGVVDEKGKYEVKDGPFNNCGGIGGAVWLSFDPKNHDHLYLVGEQHPLRKIDFGAEYLSTMYSGLSKVRCITWTLQGDSMIVTNDQNNDKNPSNYTLSRDQDFKFLNTLTIGKNCNGAAVHPVNGELYYNSFDAGQLFRYDFETKETKPLFTIQDKDWEFTVQIHPSGNYAYLVVVNKHYILRSDYDWDNKTFTTPYVICGEPGKDGYVDGVGKKVRLKKPRQGAFAPNPAYANKEDKYDFYFCDRENQCIRILSPEGKVTTFAGRGSTSVNKDAHGYINGDLRLEARFHHPEGIVYDDVRKCFFIGDRENRCIRKIAYEE